MFVWTEQPCMQLEVLTNCHHSGKRNIHKFRNTKKCHSTQTHNVVTCRKIVFKDNPDTTHESSLTPNKSNNIYNLKTHCYVTGCPLSTLVPYSSLCQLFLIVLVPLFKDRGCDWSLSLPQGCFPAVLSLFAIECWEQTEKFLFTSNHCQNAFQRNRLACGL